MKRTALATAALATVSAAAVVIPAGATAQAPGERTIVVREVPRGATFKAVDVPPRGRNPRRPSASPGDYFVIWTPLVDQAGARAGTLLVRCTVTRGARNADNASLLCDGVFVLNDGTIVVEAAVTEGGEPVVAAVTGGTGAYVGARGTLVSTPRRGGDVDTITLLP